MMFRSMAALISAYESRRQLPLPLVQCAQLGINFEESAVHPVPLLGPANSPPKPE